MEELPEVDPSLRMLVDGRVRQVEAEGGGLRDVGEWVRLRCLVIGLKLIGPDIVGCDSGSCDPTIASLTHGNSLSTSSGELFSELLPDVIPSLGESPSCEGYASPKLLSCEWCAVITFSLELEERCCLLGGKRGDGSGEDSESLFEKPELRIGGRVLAWFLFRFVLGGGRGGGEKRD